MKHLKFCNLITTRIFIVILLINSIFNSIPDITIQCYSMANERASTNRRIQRYEYLLIPDRKRSPHTLATISPTKSKSSCTLFIFTLIVTLSNYVLFSTLISFCDIEICLRIACECFINCLCN